MGLDKMDTEIIKNKLKEKGLECIDVKLVQKTREDKSNVIIYVVYFKRQSISLSELRQNYNNFDRIRVKWEYQKATSNKVTQCYNCQMFGHGSSRCKVNTFCAICAGKHPTRGCTSETVKCINCDGPHKALSLDCPSRKSYTQLKQRFQPANPRQQTRYCNETNYSSNYPNNLNQNKTAPRTWIRPPQPPDDDDSLFSFEEIKCITLELISKLRSCKTREDQFEVITTLACKFLSK